VSRLEVVLRAVLNVCIAATIGWGLSAWIAAPLFLVGVAMTAELAVRPHPRNGAEKILLICGATVTAVILIGLLLNLTPWGLTRVTWAVCWFVVSSAVLIRRRTLGTFIPIDRIRSHLRHHWVTGLYGLAALAIFVVAVIIAKSGVRVESQRPLLEFSLVSKNSSSVVVQIHAISTDGTYRIAAESGSRHARRYSSPPIQINAGANGQTLNESVPVNVAGRWEIHLSAVSGSSDSRELIIDVSQ
jgi:hypothetical protein